MIQNAVRPQQLFRFPSIGPHIARYEMGRSRPADRPTLSTDCFSRTNLLVALTIWFGIVLLFAYTVLRHIQLWRSPANDGARVSVLVVPILS